MNTPDQTPIQAASAALTRAVADDLWATSTTGDVYDVTVKRDNETWRECAERIGGIAAESTPAAVRALLAGDWLERVLGQHVLVANSGFRGGQAACLGCEMEPVRYRDREDLREIQGAHAAAVVRNAVTGGAA